MAAPSSNGKRALGNAHDARGQCISTESTSPEAASGPSGWAKLKRSRGFFAALTDRWRAVWASSMQGATADVDCRTALTEYYLQYRPTLPTLL